MRLFYVAILLCAGCGGSGDAACTTTSMETVQSLVFDSCSTGYGGCHTSAPFGANLDLTSGDAWTYLVHAPSSSSPGSWRVEPGDLDHSFLWRKLTNALASDGSEGLPMPRYLSVGREEWRPLQQPEMDAVRCWITNGANP